MLYHRLLAGLILIALLAAGLWTASSALALPVPGDYETHTNYYSSSAKTVIVGHRYVDCKGNMERTGTTTAYYTNTYKTCSY